MLYFIPAWYQQNQWCENEQIWYVRRMHTEFDDTVKQIQLFHRSGAYSYQIMLLSYTPNFRHFLHRQGVYHAPYWSCFDAIQEVRRKKPMLLSFHNLNWPDNIEFVYTPFVMIAMLRGERYARVEFGEDGNPIRIDLYKNDKIYRRNIYDDRGFVSSTILFDDVQKPLYQDYLTEGGVWKMRHFFKDGHVEINPKHREYLIVYEEHLQMFPDKGGREEFSKLTYVGMDEVISEVLASYLMLINEKDIFCVAMHERHAELLKKALRDRKVILSFFGNRYSVADHPESLDMLKRAGYIITDSQENADRIQRDVSSAQNIISITPYDSRVDFGISEEFNVQKILVPVDGLEDEVFKELILRLGEYLPANENAQIHLFTRKADYDRKKKLLEQARKVLRAGGLEEGWAVEREEQTAENDPDMEDMVPTRFFVEQCVDELTVSKCMREQRIIIDMRKVPELYLQIMAISVGIPQIVRTGTEFVKHGKNGIILKDSKELQKALDYYLAGLKNWNEAKLYSYELGKNYTSDKLIEAWKEVIHFLG